MSKEIPTPYVWTFQPQMGVAAGASQDYSTQMNWLSAGNNMSQKVFALRNQRNNILEKQAIITETPRLLPNPPRWPARKIDHSLKIPTLVNLPRNQFLETYMSNSGMQLAGGGITGGSIQLNNEYVGMPIRSDGVMQLAGGGSHSLTPLNAYLLLQSASSMPRNGGIGSNQFVKEFVPTVYYNPYSSSPASFPDQFISNYDVISDSVAEYS
ncbi:pVIII [Bat mastadenovirus WIV13]|uniref:Pre-hexon-linking protein VIII n=1 Tax=Bat mastadenovirus WIV13 TaxID=1788435 RepID=A0A1B0UHY7_9ADEN|nr:pVIII [Bat mastadenovirus WIV13]AMB43037.1 pVIII [Bat mastadenovirus WIV13]